MTTAAANYPPSCGLATTASFARSWEKRPIASPGLSLSLEQVRRTTQAGNAGTATVKDAVYSRQTSVSYETDYAARTEYAEGNLAAGASAVAVSSLDPGILTNPGAAGLMQYVANGTARVLATSPTGEASIKQVQVAAVTGGTIDTFQSYASGSLAAHIVSQVTSRATSNVRNVYSSQYVRNSAMWASGVDWSCVSPWNSAGGNTMGGTLITRRHALFCAHASFYPPQGAAIKFVGANGQEWNTTIQATTSSGSTSQYGIQSDFTVALLADTAPEYITHAEVLPVAWRQYLPTVREGGVLVQSWEPRPGSELPLVYFTQDATVNVMDWRQVFQGVQSNSLWMIEPDDALAAYYQPVRLGDSGQPVFLIINGKPVVMCVFTTTFSGSFVADSQALLAAMLTALGGGYQLTTVNLSGFPQY